MNQKITLSLFLVCCALSISKLTSAITYVDYGSSDNYALNAGDSLFIATGTYIGAITDFPIGAKITVSDLAIFNPSAFPNNSGGTLTVYGRFLFNDDFVTSDQFTFLNYGIVTIDSTVQINNDGQVWTNYFGATMHFRNRVNMSSGLGTNTINNYGTMICDSTFVMSATTLFYNYKNFTVGDSLWINGGEVNNKGFFETIGYLNINANSAKINNHCRMVSSGGIRNNSNFFNNYSYIWARNDRGLGDMWNYGKIYNIVIGWSTPMIHSRDFTTQGNALLTGKAWLYFYGTTTQSGSAVSGVNGVTTDTLKMYDVTRANASTVYDVQGGTVYPNFIYNAWGVPDSTRVYALGCSVEILLEVPLALDWINFNVLLDGDYPLLKWSAIFNTETRFDIERSYDGVRFYSIKQVATNIGQSEYSFYDTQADMGSHYILYRIRSVEADGSEKYTRVRRIDLNNDQSNNNSIYPTPNPFTGTLSFVYQSAENRTMTLQIYNVAGQLELKRSIAVNTGVNKININETANLPRGIYIIQVRSGKTITSSAKVIKL
ncbi:MAG TPA: T9SS type A sorting domain-containing protein [Chitinophagaceae bacterium]